MFLFIGWTPLMYAAKEGYLNIAKLLFNKGGDVNVKNNRVKYIIVLFLHFPKGSGL